VLAPPLPFLPPSRSFPPILPSPPRPPVRSFAMSMLILFFCKFWILFDAPVKIFFPFGFYFALLFCGINAELGIDIKEKHCKIADQVDWTCLENEGQNKFITIEAYHRGLNKHLNNCLENIPRKTIQTFDLLITLCPNCKHHPEDGPKQIIKRVNKAIQDHDIFTIFLGVHCMNTSHCNCDSKTNCGWEEDSEKGHKSNIIYLSKVRNESKISSFVPVDRLLILLGWIK